MQESSKSKQLPGQVDLCQGSRRTKKNWRTVKVRNITGSGVRGDAQLFIIKQEAYALALISNFLVAIYMYCLMSNLLALHAERTLNHAFSSCTGMRPSAKKKNLARTRGNDHEIAYSWTLL